MKIRNKFWLQSGIFLSLVIIALSLSSIHTLHKLNLSQLFEWDKLGHFLFYGATMFCFCIHCKIFYSDYSYRMMIVGFLLFCMGISLEYLQYKLAEGRLLDWLDQLANTCGIIAFYFLQKKLGYKFV